MPLKLKKTSNFVNIILYSTYRYNTFLIFIGSILNLITSLLSNKSYNLQKNMPMQKLLNHRMVIIKAQQFKNKLN